MRIIISLIFLFCTQAVFGQTSTRPTYRPFSQYYYQQSYYNPAFVGNDTQPQYWASSHSRKEGAGNDRGRSINALAQWAMYKIPINWGIIFAYQDFNSDFQDFDQWQAGLQTSFDFDLGEEGLGKIGFTGTVMQYNNDSITTSLNLKKFVPNLDVGVLAVYNKFKVGFALLQSNNPNFDPNSSSQGGNGGGSRLYRFGSIGSFQVSYEWQLTEGLKLTPQVFVRQSIDNTGTVNNNSNLPVSNRDVDLPGTSIDITLLAQFYDLFHAGFSYRPSLSDRYEFVHRYYFGSVMAGVRLNETYHVSLSWDIPRKDTPDYYSQFEIGIGVFLLRAPDEE